MSHHSARSNTPAQPANTPHRRGFFKRAAAIVIGAVAYTAPVLAALAVFLDPLRRQRAKADFVPIAPLDALPADGAPRMFQVIADRRDAWNRFSGEPVGAVFLARSAEAPEEVKAFNALCPHLGCFVGYQAARGGFYCPCHQSAFAADGAVIDPSPAERPLDALEVKVESAADSDGAGAKMILVRFQNFQAGGHEKIPK